MKQKNMYKHFFVYWKIFRCKKLTRVGRPVQCYGFGATLKNRSVSNGWGLEGKKV